MAVTGAEGTGGLGGMGTVGFYSERGRVYGRVPSRERGMLSVAKITITMRMAIGHPGAYWVS